MDVMLLGDPQENIVVKQFVTNFITVIPTVFTVDRNHEKSKTSVQRKVPTEYRVFRDKSGVYIPSTP